MELRLNSSSVLTNVLVFALENYVGSLTKAKLESSVSDNQD